MPAKLEVSKQIAAAGLRRAEIELIVTRANGEVENLGTVCAADFGRPSLLARIRNRLGV